MKSTDDAAREAELTAKVHAERARHAEVAATDLSAQRIAKSYDRVTAAKTALREHFADVAARAAGTDDADA